MKQFMRSKFVTLLCGLLVALAAHSSYAEGSDPAVMQAQTLSAALLKSMHAGRSQSPAERYRDLEPVIQQVFALPLMTRVAVGPDWESFSPEQQKALITAFTRFTTANYVYNFREFNGQKFDIDSNVSSRGEEKIVRTQIIPVNDTPTSLLYRMRDVGGTWKILDVYSDGVSELTLRRSDFGAALASGGPPALIDHLNKASDALMK
jgi:phospholipid transport system substrate-binding protein